MNRAEYVRMVGLLKKLRGELGHILRHLEAMNGGPLPPLIKQKAAAMAKWIDQAGALLDEAALDLTEEEKLTREIQAEDSCSCFGRGCASCDPHPGFREGE